MEGILTLDDENKFVNRPGLPPTEEGKARTPHLHTLRDANGLYFAGTVTRLKKYVSDQSTKRDLPE
jgi:hypothetical protein